MNARPVKITLTLCLLFLSTLAASLRAQDTGPEEATSSPGRRGPGRGGPGSSARAEAPVPPTFNIQIENGQLILDPIKDRQNPWTATHEHSVGATIDNLSKYLRVIDTNLNIVVSPGVGDIVISNLKLNTRNLRAVHEAIAVASGGVILDNGGGGGGSGFFGGQNGMRDNLTFVSERSHDQSSIEVFNLSGYIQSLGKVDEGFVTKKLDELKEIIYVTVRDLNRNGSSIEPPDFKFHSGTKLFIVIGKPEAIEVTRKIVNALTGQQPNSKVDLSLDTPPPPAQK